MLGLFSQRILMGKAQRQALRRGVLILAYHKIACPPRGTRDPFLYDTPIQFARQLSRVRQAGFEFSSLQASVGSSGRVVVTFDDGCESVLQQGLPVLMSHGVQSVQYLVPGRLGGENEWDKAKGDIGEKLMDENQVRQWLAAGQEIGSHSMTHRNLRHLGKPELREEIFGSKKALEDLFGVPIRHFSYPYGSWNSEARELVREAGYETACTMEFGVNRSGASLFELKRAFPLSSSEMIRKALHRLARRWKS